MAETKRLAVTKRDAGRGARDGVKWEGEAPAEPKRQRLATGKQTVGVAISHDGLSATMRYRLSRNPSNCQPLGFSEGQRCWTYQ
jgi:hypothetical protein